MIKKAVVASVCFAFSARAFALLAPNQMPVEIGKFSETNLPLVSVTVCEPGTTKCQTIDRIELDTGSTGLRIFSSLIRVKLPAVNSQNGKSVSECFNFGGGDQFYGPVRQADVRLGSELAPGIRIQTMEVSGPIPADCAEPASDPGHYQAAGILGLLPNTDDCQSLENCGLGQGRTFYECDARTCAVLPGISSFGIQNPVAFFAENNQGLILEFPALPVDGVKEVTGVLTFGLNSSSNNSFKPSLRTKIFSRGEGWFYVSLGGKKYWSLIDSGTNSYWLPSDFKIPGCASVEDYLCPVGPVSMNVDILDGWSRKMGSATVQVRNAERVDLSQIFAVPDLGEFWNGENDLFILGMPFFFGRKVYYGFPSGKLPSYVAF